MGMAVHGLLLILDIASIKPGTAMPTSPEYKAHSLQSASAPGRAAVRGKRAWSCVVWSPPLPAAATALPAPVAAAHSMVTQHCLHIQYTEMMPQAHVKA